MHRRAFLATTGLAGILLLTGCGEEEVVVTDPENTLAMQLASGMVLIELRPDIAPTHVARIKDLARQGFYSGLAFHRVIDGFMAQTGDPDGDGEGGSGRTLQAEFSDVPFERGTVGMARKPGRNSADSQFFIMFARQPSLDGQYTVIGKVISGMDHVDDIKRGDPGSGRVSDPDKVIDLNVYADLQVAE